MAAPSPDGPRRDGMVAERSTVVGELDRPIQPLFHHDLHGPDIPLELIQVSVMRDRPVAPHDPSRLQAQDPVELAGRGLGRCRSAASAGGRVNVGCTRQPGLQEPIRRLDRRNGRQAQVFDEAIL